MGSNGLISTCMQLAKVFQRKCLKTPYRYNAKTLLLCSHIVIILPRIETPAECMDFNSNMRSFIFQEAVPKVFFMFACHISYFNS